MLTRDFLNHNARLYGNNIATISNDGQVKHTFIEFKNRVNQLANGLMALDVGKGDRIGVLLRNMPEYLELYYAIPQIGAVVVPINYRLTEREVEFIIKNSGSVTIITQPDYIPMINSLGQKNIGLRNFIIVHGKADNYLEYESFLNNYPATEPEVDLNEDDLMALCYTSGTTGFPKGVMLTQKNFSANTFNLSMACPSYPGYVVLGCFPLFHVANAVFVNFFNTGATQITPDFDPKTVCEIIQREQPNFVWMPPAPFNFLVNYQEIDKYNLSSVRYTLSGGGHFPLVVAKKLFEVFPNLEYLFQGHGITEGASFVGAVKISRDNMDEIERVMGSVKGVRPGGCPMRLNQMPLVDIRVVDDEDNDVPEGVVGEVTYRGDNIMRGYWRNPGATADTLKNGWLHTGDMGLKTENYFFLVDRKKDMILSGDENIYSAEVEEVIMMHPAVLEAAVIGVPHEKWGETVKAIVVPKSGMEVAGEEIIEHCKRYLASYKKPTSVDIWNVPLPRNPSGKVLKTELRHPFWKKQKN